MMRCACGVVVRHEEDDRDESDEAPDTAQPVLEERSFECVHIVLDKECGGRAR